MPWVVWQQFPHVPDILCQFLIGIGDQADFQISLMLSYSAALLDTRYAKLFQACDKTRIFGGPVPGPVTIASQLTYSSGAKRSMFLLLQHDQQLALYDRPLRLSAPLPLDY